MPSRKKKSNGVAAVLPAAGLGSRFGGGKGKTFHSLSGRPVVIRTLEAFSKTGGYQGIGFSVPSNMVRLVMDQLIKAGKVTRGWIGVTIQELTPEIAQKFGIKTNDGALVNDVVKGSPAYKSGIVRGDIILEFDGKKVRDVGTLRNMVAQTKVGTQVKVRLLRRDKEMTLTVTVLELPTEIGDVIPSSTGGTDMDRNILSGMTVIDLTPAIAKQLGVATGEKGVIIVKIEPGSSADDAGIKKGDIIQEIDRQRITGLNDFNKMLSNVKQDQAVLLFVNRGGKKLYIALEPQG